MLLYSEDIENSFPGFVLGGTEYDDARHLFESSQSTQLEVSTTISRYIDQILQSLVVLVYQRHIALRKRQCWTGRIDAINVLSVTFRQEIGDVLLELFE